jgi:hypothetical protein
MYDVRKADMAAITEIRFADNSADNEPSIVARDDDNEGCVILMTNDYDCLATISFDDIHNLILALEKAKEVFMWDEMSSL